MISEIFLFFNNTMKYLGKYYEILSFKLSRWWKAFWVCEWEGQNKVVDLWMCVSELLFNMKLGITEPQNDGDTNDDLMLSR